MVSVHSNNPTRFNVLVTQDRDHAIEHWTRQLPRLLEPMGVHAYLARTAREALDVAARTELHAAVVDLLTPTDQTSSPSREPMPGGLWLLQVLHRRPERPPVVVVHDERYYARQADRLLNEALRLGAFSVVNRPMELEPLLQVIRRLIDRRYAGHWPQAGGGNSAAHGGGDPRGGGQRSSAGPAGDVADPGTYLAGRPQAGPLNRDSFPDVSSSTHPKLGKPAE